MSTPFTGPWKRIGHRYVADANGDVVCELWSTCGIEEADRREQLIASAPKLLAASIALEEWWASDSAARAGGAPAAIFMLRAAIAEAAPVTSGGTAAATPADDDASDARRYRALLADPESGRHLLSLLSQGKGTDADFRRMQDRIAVAKAGAMAGRR